MQSSFDVRITAAREHCYYVASPSKAIVRARIPVESRILLVRGQRVMIDADLALVYGVTTKALNQQVKRNKRRFPKDFMFRLTAGEKSEVVTNCDHLAHLKFSPQRPCAFTEHGAVMLASVLNSTAAIHASLYVVRAFVRLREVLAAHDDLVRRIEELELRFDAQFREVFDAIRQLMAPAQAGARRIGYPR
ncbi:MAG TPA: ORF6N domain-containing protein [Bryobacteraceae bacterium]|nr:ORF6N domain-containing protein [Bryobacteraceae bacterium]